MIRRLGFVQKSFEFSYAQAVIFTILTTLKKNLQTYLNRTKDTTSGYTFLKTVILSFLKRRRERFPLFVPRRY